MPARVAERSSWPWMLSAVALVGMGVLFVFDPSSHGFYPRCWLYATIGWQCPGCGGLRAVHSLLHGRVGEAFHFNPLFVTLLPIAVYFALNRLWQSWRHDHQSSQVVSSHWWWILGGITIAFGVLRNL